MKNALTRLTSKSVRPRARLAQIITLFAPHHLFMLTSLASLFCLAILVMGVVK